MLSSKLLLVKNFLIQEIFILEKDLSFKQRVSLLNEFTETKDLAS